MGWLIVLRYEDTQEVFGRFEEVFDASAKARFYAFALEGYLQESADSDGRSFRLERPYPSGSAVFSVAEIDGQRIEIRVEQEDESDGSAGSGTQGTTGGASESRPTATVDGV